MNNIIYWSEQGITFQTFRYDYGTNRLSLKSADKYIDSLRRQIWNRDINLDTDITDFPYLLVIDVITDAQYPGRCIVVRAAGKKSMFDSRDSFLDFVSEHKTELDNSIQKSIESLKAGFFDSNITTTGKAI